MNRLRRVCVRQVNDWYSLEISIIMFRSLLSLDSSQSEELGKRKIDKNQLHLALMIV